MGLCPSQFTASEDAWGLCPSPFTASEEAGGLERLMFLKPFQRATWNFRPALQSIVVASGIDSAYIRTLFNRQCMGNCRKIFEYKTKINYPSIDPIGFVFHFLKFIFHVSIWHVYIIDVAASGINSLKKKIRITLAGSIYEPLTMTVNISVF